MTDIKKTDLAAANVSAGTKTEDGELAMFCTQLNELCASLQDGKEHVDTDMAERARSYASGMEISAAADVLLFCASLNLMNTYVKQKGCGGFGYAFKGLIPQLIEQLEEAPMEGVCFCAAKDKGSTVTVVSVHGLQFSFHCVKGASKWFGRDQIAFDGIRKQKCAVTLFELSEKAYEVAHPGIAGIFPAKTAAKEEVTACKAANNNQGRSQEAPAAITQERGIAMTNNINTANIASTTTSAAARDIDAICASIERTIAARKAQLPRIQAECGRIDKQRAAIGGLQRQITELLVCCKDEDVRAEVLGAGEELAGFDAVLGGYNASLAELEAEFSRDTLNIGVSGGTRTGKSTTLQRITGLADEQIPSGGMNATTAVRSEIYNSERREAVVHFRTERSFIEGYVQPHVDNVNECLPEKSRISIGSLAELKAAMLPEQLEGSPDTPNTDSLKRLREAQRSVSSYEGLLGSSQRTVSIEDVSSYVTYPAPDAEARESQGGNACVRRYLAVELAQIFWPFPQLGSAMVGLVDLPGLGEIGNSASEIHLKGLEDKVDQILLVMRPTAAKAFVDAEVGRNLDQLNLIQPAVRRGDLVLAGINADRGTGRAAAENMRSHFDAEVNAGRADRYETVIYDAADEADTGRMFSMLLDRLGERLPRMDEQKLEHCMGGVDLSAQVADVAERIVRAMDRVLASIPSSDRVARERIDSIYRAVVGRLEGYSVELSCKVDRDSEAYRQFISDAERIHARTAERIEDGLFRRSCAEWDELTSSSRDFYNLYRDECKRIRYEIIDAYCGLDRFYAVHVSSFKLRVLDALLSSCGLSDFFGFRSADGADERIAKVRSELGSTLRDADFDRALELLDGVRFDFRSNVFLQISGHLAELANPAECYREGGRILSKREFLGGGLDAVRKQEMLRTYLLRDAAAANDGILAALKGENDRFNEHLAVSIDFFNNYLYGKDAENFKQVVIRGLIREYKSWVLPDADDASKSPVGILAKSVKESAQAIQWGQRPAVATSRIAKVQPSPKSAPKPVAGGKAYDGKVASLKDSGAVIAFEHATGFAFYRNIPGAKYGDLGLAEGQSVRIRVIGRDDRSRPTLEVVS